MNLLKITQTFQTEDAALDYLISQRWPNGVRCLCCDHDKVYPIVTKGKTRKPIRLFECADCGLHFSAITNTLFHDSHLPLRKWFMAMALMCEGKKGISALQVSRHIGVSYRTAWYLCHRIRKAMEEQDAEQIGSGGQTVEIDEMFLGGRVTHKERKARKIAVLGLAERGGRIHLQTISSIKAEAIWPVIETSLSPKAGQIVTDSHGAYRSIIPEEKHKVINHTDEIRLTGQVSNKTIEGAFSLFKRGIAGNYHSLSREHINAYLQEFSWRYNRRRQQSEMFTNLLRETVSKKPMTYRKLVNTF